MHSEFRTIALDFEMFYSLIQVEYIDVVAIK